MVGITLKSELLMGMGILIWIVFRCIVGMYRKKFEFKKEFILFMVAVYVLWMIGATLFPIEIIWSEEYRLSSEISINLNPLKLFDGIELVGVGIVLKNIIGNLALFVPLGIFLSMKFRNAKYYHMLATGILLSLVIELGQLLEMYFGMTDMRVVDINDIILNTCGVLIGKCIYDYLLKGMITATNVK